MYNTCLPHSPKLFKKRKLCCLQQIKALSEPGIKMNTENSLTNSGTPIVVIPEGSTSARTTLELDNSLSGYYREAGYSPLPVLDDEKEEGSGANQKDISRVTSSHRSYSEIMTESQVSSVEDTIEMPEVVASLIKKENAKKNMADTFEVISTLANSKSTTVFEVKHAATKEKCALKRLQGENKKTTKKKIFKRKQIAQPKVFRTVVRWRVQIFEI
ncbi:hypothetical protein RFI_15110, partial [Reticulomyxa filosa]